MNFSAKFIQRVWEKATAVRGSDPDKLRKDPCGAWIAREDFLNHDSKFGWDINFIKPLEEGGRPTLSNVRPFQWENNKFRQNGHLICPVRAVGKGNFKVFNPTADQRT